MIKVWAEPEKRRIIGMAKGFLSLEDVDRFSEDEQRICRQNDWRTGEFDLLMRTLECIIQPQDVMARFATLLHTSEFKSRRVAVVREKILSRMQTQRVLNERDGTRLFETVEAAEAWLSEGWTPALAA